MADETLAALLMRVIECNQERINTAAELYPDEPIAVTLHWHPKYGKVEPSITVSDRLPPFKV